MNRLLKIVLSAIVVPVVRLLRPAMDRLERLFSYVMLASKVSTTVDRSVVVLGAIEIEGSGRIQFGHNLRLSRDLCLETRGPGSIDIGDDVVISRGAHIVSHAAIRIGRGSMIGEYTSIRDGNHRRDEFGAVRETGHDSAPIGIGEAVWIGRGVTILPGVNIGDRATIGANAVVTRDVPSGAIAAGVPARILPRRADRQEPCCDLSTAAGAELPPECAHFAR
jgi:acetyltransferase-like isoleucine patch superfamily enzyme